MCVCVCVCVCVCEKSSPLVIRAGGWENVLPFLIFSFVFILFLNRFCLYLSIKFYKHTHTYTHTYIYIQKERYRETEREAEKGFIPGLISATSNYDRTLQAA